MKNLKKIFILLLSLTLVFCLFSCGENEVCTHEDADADGKCDKCGETVTVEECTHEDGDSDGKCDKCGEAVEPPKNESLTLIDGGTVKFQFVQGEDVKVDVVKIIDKLQDRFEDDFKAELKIVKDNGNDIEDIEVLIGTVTSRGENYEYNKYTLGSEGYAITRIGNKIIVTGGSDAALETAVNKFIEDVLGIKKTTKKLDTVVYEDSDEVIEVQDNYRIESITVDENDIADYKIVIDIKSEKASATYKAAANKLQSFFYEKAGYYLPISTNPDSVTGNAIYLRQVGIGEAGSKGFRITVKNGSLYIDCAHYNKFNDAFSTYYNKTLAYARDTELKLLKYDSDIDITRVTYTDFGAKADGKVNDYAAMKATHDFANEGGQTVYAKSSDIYLLTDIPEAIEIRTNVNWNGAKIIIDDSNVTVKNNKNTGDTPVIYDNGAFKLVSEHKDFTASQEFLDAINAKRDEDGLVIRGLESGKDTTTKLDIALGYPAMLTIYNANHRNYIRYGYTDAKGNSNGQFELVVVDEYGNVDPSTPFLHDYTEVTSIIVHRLDVEPISIKNATIESIASRVNLLGGYYSIGRGITINRPNVTIDSIKHVITGEIPKHEPVRLDENGLAYSVRHEGFSNNGTTIIKDGKTYSGDDVKPFTGHSYGGIISISKTCYVNINKVTFQSRVYYEEGTYDIGVYLSNSIIFTECDQSNFFEEGTTKPNMSKCWGVAGTNYCKNMDYISSKLTRYDAHSGVTNGKIIDSEIAVLRLIGGGDFIIENTIIWPSYGSTVPLQLREDYGASFNGTLTIKDCTIKAGIDGSAITTLVSMPATYWDMGYKTFCPNFIIDNLEVEGAKKGHSLYLFGLPSYNLQYDATHHFPYIDPIRTDPSDPATSGYKFHYETSDADTWVAENITKEGARFHGCKYEIKKHSDNLYTVIVEDTKNQYPYYAPEFIEVKNISDKSYQLCIYNAKFFKNTEIKDADGVVKMVRVPN